jgi:hypothetical protein
MNYDLTKFFKFMEEQRQKLLSTIDWSQDSDEEFSAEFMLSNIEDESK